MARKTGNTVDDNTLILETLTNEKKEKKDIIFREVTVERVGDKIILPEGMSYKHARDWLKKMEESEETLVQYRHTARCFPFDGANALYQTMKRTFGFVDLVAVPTFFGPIPPKMVEIQVDVNTTIQAPWGRMQLPGFDDECYIQTAFDPKRFEFVITGIIRRKHEPAMQALSKIFTKYLQENSIYRGKAIRVDLNFLQNPDVNPFSSEMDKFPPQPKFIDTSKINENDLILSDTAAMEMANVFLRIERTEDCRRQDIPLKHGCLLAGPYGTGKSLTAAVTARKCVENDWTYIYLEDVRQLGDGLRFAELYAPAVIFAEDCDKVTEGGRTNELNKVLNTLDGVDTKHKPIITVLTTNHEDRINKAFLRAGRIDTLVWMEAMNAHTAQKFLEKILVDDEKNSLIRDGEDLTEACAMLEGIVPAFITAVAQKVKVFTMLREGVDITGKVTSHDIATAANAVRKHIDLAREEKELNKLETIGLHTVKAHAATAEEYERIVEGN